MSTRARGARTDSPTNVTLWPDPRGAGLLGASPVSARVACPFDGDAGSMAPAAARVPYDVPRQAARAAIAAMLERTMVRTGCDGREHAAHRVAEARIARGVTERATSLHQFCAEDDD